MTQLKVLLCVISRHKADMIYNMIYPIKILLVSAMRLKHCRKDTNNDNDCIWHDKGRLAILCYCCVISSRQLYT